METKRTMIAKIRLLDAGCGTGNYGKAFLERGVGHVTLLDTSTGMLSVASSKLETEIQSGRVEVTHHTLPSLPYPDESFDVITLIFVLHQIDTQPDDGETSYPNLIKCIKEVYRVLTRNGIVLIVTPTQEQVLKAAWYRPLIPKAVRKFQRRCMPVPDIIHLLKDSGFKETTLLYRPGRFSFLEKHIYFDLDGPLKEEWRGSNSLWSLVDEEELDNAIKILTELKENGKLQSYFEENDQYRQQHGISVDLIGKK